MAIREGARRGAQAAGVEASEAGATRQLRVSPTPPLRLALAARIDSDCARLWRRGAPPLLAASEINPSPGAAGELGGRK
jgi:hypothetical protein